MAIAQVTGSPEGASKLVRLMAKHGQLHFMLESEYDPYQRGHRIEADRSDPQYLSFSSDHRYLHHNRRERHPGYWHIHVKQGKLSIRKRPQAQRGGVEAHVFTIRSFDGEQLVLIWQGRHGYVLRSYRLFRKGKGEERSCR